MTSPDDAVKLRALAAAFRMPSVQTMVSRKSSITNAFVNSIIPVIPPNIDEISEALRILGMEADNLRCAYCSDRATEWDHLRPLVVNRRPTGFISEIANLVPSCGKCNQSKGNNPWRKWMFSNARLSPSGRGLTGVEARAARLDAYEQWRTPMKVDFEKILGSNEWEKYWALCDEVNARLRECQDLAEILRATILRNLGR